MSRRAGLSIASQRFRLFGRWVVPDPASEQSASETRPTTTLGSKNMNQRNAIRIVADGGYSATTRLWMISSRMMATTGVMSIMPMGGMMRRSGTKTGSVMA